MANLPLNSKPLNPNAESFFPDAKKPSGIPTQTVELHISFPRDDKIYGGVPAATVFEPFPQAPPFQFCPPVTVPVTFPVPVWPTMFESSPNRNVPFDYPVYTFPEHLFQEQQGSDGFLMQKNSYKYPKLFKDSNTPKGISSIPGKPKFLGNKLVPPLLKRRYFIEDFQERECLPKNVWTSKEEEIISTDHSPSEEEPPVCNKTTLMLKNVPNQYRRDSLMEFLDKKCCESDIAYDFLYLPMDFIQGNNRGFAFVNFTTALAAMKIKAALQDYKWGEFRIPNGRFSSKKTLDITWARIQGKDALVKNFVNSRFSCDNEEYLPVIVFPAENGVSSFSTVGHLHSSGIPQPCHQRTSKPKPKPSKTSCNYFPIAQRDFPYPPSQVRTQLTTPASSTSASSRCTLSA